MHSSLVLTWFQNLSLAEIFKIKKIIFMHYHVAKLVIINLLVRGSFVMVHH